MGAIDLARVTFIKDHGTTDSRLDILARLVVLQVSLFLLYLYEYLFKLMI